MNKVRKSCFPPVAGPDARILILGSLPGERSLAERQYYAHPQNQFWRLLGGVVGEELATLAYEARLEALLRHRVALWDVVASATRTGSSDAAIREEATNDLPALLGQLPYLRAIGLNGTMAAKLARVATGTQATQYELVALPSSSALHTIGFDAKLPAWTALRRYLA